MKFISHRGNVKGRDPKRENSPLYIDAAIAAGFDVEVDVWKDSVGIRLGHDEPSYRIDDYFLIDRKQYLWCHAKSIETLPYLLQLGVHCFWHQEDDVTLTSKGWIWTYPGKTLVPYRSIAVVPERVEGWDLSCAEGICSDEIARHLETSVK